MIVVEGKWKDDGMEATMINEYASNAFSEQRVLWGELKKRRKQFQSPWILGGDFNAVKIEGDSGGR
ncbi:hypothetical protein PVK06_041818 [Gossypium arboreum]|uniref:Uncharacterized protein n=1 Tax=Gossypium arboreum TaxID=29729 RepID=A0ABR0N9V4_GOSAR|nr:hypothetical protein PVK06_041818 [Gossypium arboreum]